jgi:KGK domain
MKFMTENITSLQLEDVIHIPTSEVLGLSSTFKVDELINHIREIANEKFNYQKLYIFDSNGCSCNILRQSNTGWQTGKIRISVEFIVEVEDENSLNSQTENSPLDEIRQLNS